MSEQFKLTLLGITFLAVLVTAGLVAALDGYNNLVASQPPLRLIQAQQENAVVRVTLLNSVFTVDGSNSLIKAKKQLTGWLKQVQSKFKQRLNMAPMHIDKICAAVVLL